MSQKIIIPMVIVLIVVAGYFAFKPSTNTNTNNVTETHDESLEPEGTHSEENEVKKMAFGEFIKQGGSYKCTVDMHVGEVDASGTIYVNNGQIKTEYSMQSEGMTMNANMIVRDGYTYSWTSAMPNMGFKIKNTASAGAVGATGNAGFDANQIGDYDCHAWTATAATFALPAGVTFQEM